MKSVCILVQNYYEIDIRVRRKAEALVAAGYSVDVLALASSYSTSKDFVLNGVAVSTLSLGKKRGSLVRYLYEYLAFLVWCFFKLARRMGKRRYAIIDVNNLPDFLVFAAVWARLRGAKIVFDMHEITPEFYMSKYKIGEGSFLIRLMKWIEWASFRFADRVITINEPIQLLLEGRGLARSKSTIIMNSVDESLFAAALSLPETDSPKRPGSFVMMYHGTLTYIYGLDIAIEAFGKAHRDMPEAELWILGNGPEKESLQRQSRDLGLEGKVKFIGNVLPQEVPQWLRRCDVGVLATRRDVFLEFSFSNKLSEYIIMGKGVIASRLKAIRHCFTEDALAYFEPNNASELAAQMIRLFKDPALRVQLAETARREYTPICWEVMKNRYLTMMDGLIKHQPVDRQTSNPPAAVVIRHDDKTAGGCCSPRQGPPAFQLSPATTHGKDPKETALKLLNYCRANDWAGYDPYDALNSKLFESFPFLDSRIPRLILTQALKRSVFNLRPLLQIPKTHNPKGLALFLSALLKLSRLGVVDNRETIGFLLQMLVSLRSSDSPYWCWGYSFAWQTRTIIVPRRSPNVVCTLFVAGALLDLYEQTGDAQFLSMGVSAAEYVRQLIWTDKGVVSLSYPLQSLRSEIHNANLLGAALLCRVSRLSGEKSFVEPALSLARYSAAKQRDDGSWPYGELPTQQWIDNFHTGYNLCALRSIGKDAETSEFETHLQRGFEFYLNHFFREDGAPRYYHDNTYPIDGHCVAQSIITLLELKDLGENSVRLSNRVFDWAMANMWDRRGFFFYRVLPLCRIKTSYMRWVQAWMLLATAILLEHSQTCTAQSPSGRVNVGQAV
jgi:glycosyltransferase involved in cell wall biosynthesis